MGDYIGFRAHTCTPYAVCVHQVSPRRVDDGAGVLDQFLAVGPIFTTAPERDVCGTTMGQTDARLWGCALTKFKVCERRNVTMDISGRIGA